VKFFLSLLTIAFTSTQFLASVPVSAADKPADQHLVLISIDGFAAYYLTDPLSPIPTIRRLAAEGVAARALKVADPSITWPNHTTLVTGTAPVTHDLFYNGKVVATNGPTITIDGRRDKKDLFAGETVYDLLHSKGLTTAGVNWPATRNSGTLDDDFPDVPDQVIHTTPRLRTELVSGGWLLDATQTNFARLSASRKDQIWTAAAAHLIRTRKPNFLMLHLLITDSTQHKYGPKTPAAYTALAQADFQVAEIVRALEEAKIRDRTTILLVSDHGFAAVTNLVLPNVLLKEQGLLETDSKGKITSAKVQAMAHGGISMIYALSTNATGLSSLAAKLGQLPGVDRVLAPDSFGSIGLEQKIKTSQVGDWILLAKPGFGFGTEADGTDLTVQASVEAGTVGKHGFPSNNPLMNGLFVASGYRIRKGTNLGTVDNRDLAPTMAHLFGFELTKAEGKVLKEILVGN